MAEENQVDEQEQESKPSGGGGGPSFLQGNLVKLIIRFLGWGVAILVGIGLMVLTQIVVLELRGDAPDKQSIIDPRAYSEIPIYSTHNLDQFVVTLDRTDESQRTTSVTVDLVLAYPPNNQAVDTELNNRRAQIADHIQSVISRKRYEDINRADKRQTILKYELINEINSLLTNKGVVDIYITKFEITRR